MKMRPHAPIHPAGFLAVLLLLVPQACRAATEVLDPTVTGSVSLVSGVFTLETNPFSLTTQQLLSSNIDSRVILEFPLASLTAEDVISAATLKLDVNLFSSPGGNLPVVPVFGYAGNGAAAVGDAAVNSNIIGVSNPISALGLISIDLDAEYIAGLIGNATHLGLLLVGSANGSQASFDNFIDTPVLNISIGTPGDFDTDGDVDGRDFLIWQRGGSPTPLSPEDLMDWEINYGTEPPILIGAVPEPTTLGLALVALLGALTRRSLAIC